MIMILDNDTHVNNVVLTDYLVGLHCEVGEQMWRDDDVDFSQFEGQNSLWLSPSLRFDYMLLLRSHLIHLLPFRTERAYRWEVCDLRALYIVDLIIMIQPSSSNLKR
jgi:hypothetical protein